MNNSAHALWVEKYRPRTLEDYVFHDPQHKAKMLELIEAKTIPHLMFSGVRGSGKTTLAQILIEAIGVDPMDVLTINASSKRGIDTFREDITNFASAMPMGDFKVIHLEEGDRLTSQAQDALKSFTEENSEYVRFILTCNRAHMVTPELRSRFQEFHMKPSDKDEVLEYLVKILASEQVKFSLDQIDEYAGMYYPDTRKIVNNLQQNTVAGRLQSPSANAQLVSEYKPQVLEMINSDNWVGAREVVCSNVATEEWDEFYRFLYDSIGTTKKFTKRDNWEEAIILIADYMYRHTLVGDPEVNAAALMIKLSKI